MSANYRETDNYVFFQGGIFSQWYPCDIIIDSVKYCTAEQYMMAEKARLFGDDASLRKIMRACDPAVQKSCGRQVKNFDKDKWEAIAQDVVFKANLAKFTQHADWQDQLLNTGNKEIVEASPTDCIWGIGMYCSDPGIEDPKNWRGTNWLGEAIMKVREQLTKEITNG